MGFVLFLTAGILSLEFYVIYRNREGNFDTISPAHGVNLLQMNLKQKKIIIILKLKYFFYVVPKALLVIDSFFFLLNAVVSLMRIFLKWGGNPFIPPPCRHVHIPSSNCFHSPDMKRDEKSTKKSTISTRTDCKDFFILVILVSVIGSSFEESSGRVVCMCTVYHIFLVDSVSATQPTILY